METTTTYTAESIKRMFEIIPCRELKELKKNLWEEYIQYNYLADTQFEQAITGNCDPQEYHQLIENSKADRQRAIEMLELYMLTAKEELTRNYIH